MLFFCFVVLYFPSLLLVVLSLFACPNNETTTKQKTIIIRVTVPTCSRSRTVMYLNRTGLTTRRTRVGGFSFCFVVLCADASSLTI